MSIRIFTMQNNGNINAKPFYLGFSAAANREKPVGVFAFLSFKS